MTTTTATPEPPERGREELFSLSDAEVSAISKATGVREDIVPAIRGESYAEVRDNAVKMADLAPSSRTESEPRRVDNADRLAKASALAERIRTAMGGA